MNKRILCMSLAATMLVTMIGCGKSSTPTAKADDKDTSTVVEATEEIVEDADQKEVTVDELNDIIKESFASADEFAAYSHKLKDGKVDLNIETSEYIEYHDDVAVYYGTYDPSTAVIFDVPNNESYMVINGEVVKSDVSSDDIAKETIDEAVERYIIPDGSTISTAKVNDQVYTKVTSTDRGSWYFDEDLNLTFHSTTDDYVDVFEFNTTHEEFHVSQEWINTAKDLDAGM